MCAALAPPPPPRAPAGGDGGGRLPRPRHGVPLQRQPPGVPLGRQNMGWVHRVPLQRLPPRVPLGRQNMGWVLVAQFFCISRIYRAMLHSTNSQTSLLLVSLLIKICKRSFRMFIFVGWSLFFTFI